MAVWLVEDSRPGATKRRLFIGGCCAVVFYNEDRDHRAQPDLVDTKPGEVAEDCHHGEVKKEGA